MNSTLSTIKKLVAALTLLTLAACNPFAAVSDAVSSTGYGKITVWMSNPTYYGGTVYISDNYSSTATMSGSYYLTSAPTCGTTTSLATSTYTAAVGTHYISAYAGSHYFSAYPSTATVTDGGCTLVELY